MKHCYIYELEKQKQKRKKGKNLPSGESNEISRLAKVSRTIGRFSRIRSSAGNGKNPT